GDVGRGVVGDAGAGAARRARLAVRARAAGRGADVLAGEAGGIAALAVGAVGRVGIAARAGGRLADAVDALVAGRAGIVRAVVAGDGVAGVLIQLADLEARGSGDAHRDGAALAVGRDVCGGRADDLEQAPHRDDVEAEGDRRGGVVGGADHDLEGGLAGGAGAGGEVDGGHAV